MKKLLLLTILCLSQGAFGMKNLNDQLVEAAKSGDRHKVKDLLSRGADVDGAEGNPLREALKNGHLEVAQLLLENNANVEAPSPMRGWLEPRELRWHYPKQTLLFEAIRPDDVEVQDLMWNLGDDKRKATVELLLAYGANPLFPIPYTTAAMKEITFTPLTLAGPEIVAILVTGISNSDAERIRKHYYAAIMALKTKREWVNPDIRRILAKQIFNNLVQERMERARSMLERADRMAGNDGKAMIASSAAKLRNMIAANISRILSCSGQKNEEYICEDPSAWEPEFCTIQ